MAEKTVISIEVEGIGKATNSVKGLKQELKSLIDQQQNVSQGGKLWKALGKEINEVEGKIGDVTDSFKTLQGSGVDRVSSSLGLLKEGFASFDIGKIGIALKGLGSAFKSVLPFALIEGIMYLVENFEELSRGSGVLAKILQGVGAAITWVKNAVTDLIGVTDDSTRALEKQGEAIKKASDTATQKLGEQNAAYDRQIAAIKATGKSAIEVEKAKQENIIKTNMILAKQIESYVRAGGELDEEKRKQLAGNLEAIRAARATEKLDIVADHKDQLAKYKEHLEKHLAAYKKRYEDQLMFDEDEKKRRESELAIRVQLGEKEVADREITLQQLQGTEEKYRQIDYENLQAFNEKKKAEDLKNAQNGIELANQSLQATQALSDIFFAQKLGKAQKGSAEETAIAKKQFEVNKGLQIAQATMQGAQAVLAAYASGSAIPIIGAVAGPLYAVAAGLVAIKNIQQIKATQFGGGTPNISAGSANAPTLPTSNGTPSIAPPPQNTTTFTGNNNNNFNNQPIKVYLPETDINNATKSADKIKAQATF